MGGVSHADTLTDNTVVKSVDMFDIAGASNGIVRVRFLTTAGGAITADDSCQVFWTFLPGDSKNEVLLSMLLSAQATGATTYVETRKRSGTSNCDIIRFGVHQ
jgi:hypothetical protein